MESKRWYSSNLESQFLCAFVYWYIKFFKVKCPILIEFEIPRVWYSVDKNKSICQEIIYKQKEILQYFLLLPRENHLE